MTDFAKLREVMSKMDDDYRAYFTDEELAETPAQRKVRLAAEKAAKTLPKGSCPKCGKHIGRGVHFHAKACNG